MKYMVRAGWQDIEFESDNPNVGYALVMWVGGSKFVTPYEEEAQAYRALNYQLKKYDKQGMPARGQFYPAWAA